VVLLKRTIILFYHDGRLLARCQDEYPFSFMLCLMPRVSEQYLADRRAQILLAARRCFGRNGFHQTSMQDLFAEAGMSAGAIYRYFRSKDEMVVAIAEETFGEVIDTMLSVARRDRAAPLGEALAAAVELIASKDETDGLCALAVQVWSEAQRNPELAASFGALVRKARAEVTRMVRLRQDAGMLPDGATASAIASVVTAILPGYIMQRALLGPGAVRGVPDGLRALWPNVPATARRF
jgi:TetR/AcrR family transcriptional regulator, transcriptional repressor of aconitase